MFFLKAAILQITLSSEYEYKSDIEIWIVIHSIDLYVINMLLGSNEYKWISRMIAGTLKTVVQVALK